MTDPLPQRIIRPGEPADARGCAKPLRSYYLTAAISVAPLKKCAVEEAPSIRLCRLARRRWAGTASILPAIESGPIAIDLDVNGLMPLLIKPLP